MSLYNFLFQYGFAGFLLYVCVFVAAMITFERIYFVFILHNPKKDDIFLKSLLDGLKRETSKPLSIREMHIAQDIDKIEGLFNKGLIVLKFISIISPMLGLFGTILGMISIFGSIAESNTPVTPSLISGGLREALYTTAIGISISIPAMSINVFFNSIISNRIQHYIYTLNEANIEVDYKHHD